MKVVYDRDDENLVRFGNLKNQDVFEIPGLNGIFMKVPTQMHDGPYDSMAVRLTNAKNSIEIYICVEDWVMVVPLEAELNVKRKNKDGTKNESYRSER